MFLFFKFVNFSLLILFNSYIFKMNTPESKITVKATDMDP